MTTSRFYPFWELIVLFHLDPNTKPTLTKYAPQGKLAIFAMILHSRQQKNISRDSRDIKVDPQQVQDPSWSFNGPYKAPKMDLIIFEPISGFYTISTLYIIY